MGARPRLPRGHRRPRHVDQRLLPRARIVRDGRRRGDVVVGTPVRFSDTPSRAAADAPELGQHTEEVLLEIGYTWDEIAHLQERGAI